MNQKRRETGIFLAGVAVLVILVAGLAWLFHLRFLAGDIYPPYSSLRYDPLGARAFYESLESCPGLTVSRNYKPIEETELSGDTAVMYLGDSSLALSDRTRIPRHVAGTINSFWRDGGRMVLTLLPRNVGKPSELAEILTDEEEDEEDPKTKDKDGKKGKKNGTPPPQNVSTNESKAALDPEDLSDPSNQSDPSDRSKKGRPTPRQKRHEDFLEKLNRRTITVSEWLGVQFHDQPVEGPAFARLDKAYTNFNLPSSISCHTSLCFTNVSKEWSVVYRRGEYPVIVERKIGQGSFVLSALTYYVSNEALREERYPAILAWLVGDKRNVVFDEQHHGVEEYTGVATLARKYRLEWLALTLLALAVLYVWQKTSSIVPSYESSQDGQAPELAAGKDSTAGLINLLRRSIPPGLILETCVYEWKRTQRAKDQRMARKITEMEAILHSNADIAGRIRKPAELYNRISKILKRNE